MSRARLKGKEGRERSAAASCERSFAVSTACFERKREGRSALAMSSARKSAGMRGASDSMHGREGGAAGGKRTGGETKTSAAPFDDDEVMIVNDESRQLKNRGPEMVNECKSVDEIRQFAGAWSRFLLAPRFRMNPI